MSRKLPFARLESMADWTPLSFNLEYCHDQSQSSLFSTIPPEIRTLIFNFALLDYEDLTDPYPQFAPYYRLGHRGRIRSDTGLLSTCRLIFLETRELPLRLATFTFWKWDEAEYGGPLAYNGRPFYYGDLEQDVHYGLRKLQPFQLQLVQKIQIIVDIFWIMESDWLSAFLPRSPVFNPTHITISFGDPESFQTLIKGLLIDIQDYSIPQPCHHLPNSVRAVTVEVDVAVVNLLTVHDEKSVARYMSRCRFKLDDGTEMTPDTAFEIVEWEKLDNTLDPRATKDDLHPPLVYPDVLTYHTIRKIWRPGRENMGITEHAK